MNGSHADELRLLAYVDGELDAGASAEVEALLARDPQASAFVAAERALRAQLQAAFTDVLAEPVPDRLSALVNEHEAGRAAQRQPRGDTANHAARDVEAAHAPGAANDVAGDSGDSGDAGDAQIVDLGAERARRADAPDAVPTPTKRRHAWPTWLGLAACLLLGFALGERRATHPADNWSAAADGRLLARGALADALEHAPSGGAAAGTTPVRLAGSFVARDGAYCRSFSLARPALAGLACREGGHWQLQTLAAAAPAADSDHYRQAASALPPPLLAAIDDRIAGAPLDAAAEASALRDGWRR